MKKIFISLLFVLLFSDTLFSQIRSKVTSINQFSITPEFEAFQGWGTPDTLSVAPTMTLWFYYNDSRPFEIRLTDTLYVYLSKREYDDVNYSWGPYVREEVIKMVPLEAKVATLNAFSYNGIINNKLGVSVKYKAASNQYLAYYYSDLISHAFGMEIEITNSTGAATNLLTMPERSWFAVSIYSMRFRPPAVVETSQLSLEDVYPKLMWEVNDNSNIDHFIIESSPDNVVYSQVSMIEKNDTKHYEWTDYSTTTTDMYYKIIQVHRTLVTSELQSFYYDYEEPEVITGIDEGVNDPNSRIKYYSLNGQLTDRNHKGVKIQVIQTQRRTYRSLVN